MIPRAATVSELNAYVAALLAGDEALHGLRVVGEISGFKRHTSGHLYFSLKDANAVVRCVMFRSQAIRLRFQPRDGMQVTLTGYASLYERDGSFQLYAMVLEERGAGELYQEFMARKARLEAEGYFDESQKKPVPFLPRCVGVITSETSAAVQDVLQILGRRFPGMPVALAPVRVQGAGAAEEIAGAIRRMDALRAADVLIVGRGGGSIEDLWAFNELCVAEAIHDCQTPVISAVGHETDFTIADFVADLRAPTPSAAAELAVPEKDALYAALSDDSARMRNALLHAVATRRARVELMTASQAFFRMRTRILAERQAIDGSMERMRRASLDALRMRRALLDTHSERLRALSPLGVLERGYALVRDADGAAITNAASLHSGQTVTVQMRDGRAEAVVGRITLEDE